MPCDAVETPVGPADPTEDPPIDPKSDMEPDPDPEPEPNCDEAQFGANPQLAKALGRLKQAAASTRQVERYRMNKLMDKAIASNALNAEQVLRLRDALSYASRSLKTRKSNGQKNTGLSCPKPDKQSCFEGALETYRLTQSSCIATLVFQGMMSGLTGYPPISTVFDDYERCKNSAEAALEFRLQWCNSLED